MNRYNVPAIALSFAALVGSGFGFHAEASPSAAAHLGVPRGFSAKNVSVVAYSDVDGRPPFKLAIQERRGRWYLYMGHLWHRGWTIMDVTDPSKPEVVNFISGPANTWTIQMEVFAGKMITALERIAPGWGGDPSQPNDEGVLIWDLKDPVSPVQLGHFLTGGTGTHRNGYYGGPYVHLAAGMPGYSGNIYVIIDISTPSKPIEVGRWWVPGQHKAGGESPELGVSLHGPPYVEGNRAYLSYGAAGLVILDISNPARPELVGRLDFSPPFLGNIGVHSALPLSARNLALVTSEAIAEDCQEPLNQTSLVDIANPAKPVLVSVFPVPVPPRGSPFRNFCEKGGRFGPHNFNQNQQNPFVQRSDRWVYLTYFNAGLRIYDISDARTPREVGWFIPPDPTKRIGTLPKKLVSQTEDVLVDARGYIYISNKNQGLWILRFNGAEDEDRNESR
jgi:hypothetical protein